MHMYRFKRQHAHMCTACAERVQSVCTACARPCICVYPLRPCSSSTAPLLLYCSSRASLRLLSCAVAPVGVVEAHEDEALTRDHLVARVLDVACVWKWGGDRR